MLVLSEIREICEGGWVVMKDPDAVLRRPIHNNYALISDDPSSLVTRKAANMSQNKQLRL